MADPTQVSGDNNARIRHVENEVAELKDGQRAIFGKLDQISIALAGMQGSKPNALMQFVSLGLQLLTTSVLLIGATVATITYIASNANNGDMALVKERVSVLRERLQHIEQSRASPAVAGWTAEVRKP
jgi:hypothetical protein